MDTAEKLCNELFSWIDQQVQCAEDLKVLVAGLEDISETQRNSIAAMPAQLVFLLMVLSLSRSTQQLLANRIVKKWKSSGAMSNVKKTAGQIEMILNNIAKLQKMLSEECEIQVLEASSSDEVQYEITARILKAMANRRKRDLPLSYLKHLLRNDDNIVSEINLNTTFFQNVSHLLAALEYPFNILKTIIQTDQVTGLVIKSVPVLIKNCIKEIKNNHQPEACKFLKKEANELCKAMTILKTQLNDIEETLYQMEYHIDLSPKEVGSRIYTGTIYVAHQQTCKKLENFILVCSKDVSLTPSGRRKFNDENKEDENKEDTQVFNRPIPSDWTDRKRWKAAPDQEPQYQETTNGEDFSLPQITLSNVRSLPNKMETLVEMTQYHHYFATSPLIFFTETWLKSNSDSDAIRIDHFNNCRADRNPVRTNKKRGGGIIAYIKTDWGEIAEHQNIYTKNPHIELMYLSIKPKKGPILNFIAVYVPPKRVTNKSAKEIAVVYNQKNAEKAFLLGDLNRCKVNLYLNNTEQYVTCPTRGQNTLDVCYGNVPGAYRSICRSPLGKSDHNVIHLIPKDQPPFENCTHEMVQHRQPKKTQKKKKIAVDSSNVGKAYTYQPTDKH